ncbi:iron dicitrate transporter FecR [Pedobacter psychrotolerans]|nr:iron dicitrate transporter FecR [Pedobacter psychrotolerans]
MPRQYDIDDLLQKFKNGSIQPDELDFLETWYLNWKPENQDIGAEDIKQAQERVWVKLNPSPKKHQLWQWLSAAAAVFLIAAIFWPGQTNYTKKQTLTHQQIKEIKPGSNKAILTLAGGKDVVLGKNISGNISTQGEVSISQKNDGTLVYAKSNVSKNKADLFNKVTTPRGGEYQLVLSDGTKVWLNAASSITFPVAFTGGKRSVTVTGEAYFEVAHDQNKPFIVSAADQQITVLGTHFNVSAYAEDEQTTTALISGLINVRKGNSGKFQLVHPGQGAVTSLANQGISIEPINTDEVLSWKNGYFQFDNQSIYTIMKIMSRWYDVDVEFLDKKSTERFGGTFSRAKNLSESLANLEKLGKVHFKITSGKVIVSN